MNNLKIAKDMTLAAGVDLGVHHTTITIHMHSNCIAVGAKDDVNYSATVTLFVGDPNIDIDGAGGNVLPIVLYTEISDANLLEVAYRAISTASELCETLSESIYVIGSEGIPVKTLNAQDIIDAFED